MRSTTRLLKTAPQAITRTYGYNNNHIISSRFISKRSPLLHDDDDEMSSSSSSRAQPLEGLLAINKPTGISSAEALRRLQKLFKPSSIFAATLQAEKEKREQESHNQRNRRKKQSAKRVDVKIGHGGTLDPMASGVLIAGIGAGTKKLQDFLVCTKTYEATAMFGAGTDTYDSEGKVIAWANWEGITREKVEEALGQFRGDIMQKPPMWVVPSPR
jgi:tRNA pseudouridine55 synthase